MRFDHGGSRGCYLRGDAAGALSMIGVAVVIALGYIAWYLGNRRF
jgi:hypothetical protein